MYVLYSYMFIVFMFALNRITMTTGSDCHCILYLHMER